MKYLVLTVAVFCLLAAATAAPAEETGLISTTAEPVKGCLYNGIEHGAGETYKADCNTCHCVGNNLAMCTLMACIGQQ